MPNRETISLLASTGMLAPAMWLYDSYRAPRTPRRHTSLLQVPLTCCGTKSTTRIATSSKLMAPHEVCPWLNAGVMRMNHDFAPVFAVLTTAVFFVSMLALILFTRVI